MEKRTSPAERIKDRQSIKAVIFDFDGVFVNRFTQGSVRDFCRTFGVGERAFRKSLSAAVKKLDTGREGEEDYFAQAVRMFGLPVSPRVLERFFAERDGVHLKEHAAMFRLLKKLDGRFKTVLLSNASRDLSRRLRARGFYKKFDKVFLSYRMGVAKPSLRAYRYALRSLRLAPESVVFIDDSRKNIEAARKMGMRTILHRNTATTIAALRKLLA